jgi:hypothetical protein
LAYPGEIGTCPNCGSSQALDEDTRSGVMNEEGKQVWAIDLMIELFQKAVGANRIDDAERVMRQTMGALENCLKGRSPVDAARLEPVAHAAIQLSDLQGDGFWVRWAVDYHTRAGSPISSALIDARDRWDYEDPVTARQ